MKFVSIAVAALAFALPTFAQSTPVTYDTTYDQSTLSLNNVACSNGANGLESKGYTTLGSLPTFPNLGGMYPIVWNSALCGTCWSLTYNSKTIYVLAVDYAGVGFNIGKEAMNNLTNGVGIQTGKVDVTATQVAASHCGL